MISPRSLVLSGAAKVASRFLEHDTTQKMLFNALRLNRRETKKIIANDDVRFISYCLARREYSRSQILQDLWVCFELGEKREGFFVEFGATNGVKNSNTWLLEKKFGWKGILAEPNPIWHSDLSVNRDAFIEQYCISSKTGASVEFMLTNDTDPELSGIAEFADIDHFAEIRSQGQKIKVNTISLDDLLDKYNAPTVIDYMSIDTKGSELDILSSYSFRHRFKVVTVENNPKNEILVDKILSLQGYKRVFKQFSQWDSWFVSSELRSEQHKSIVAPDK